MTMTDTQRLDHRIAAYLRPVTPTKQGGRVMVASGAEDMLAVYLREIAETLLPRRLILTADNGDCLTVDVSNRTILRLVHASGHRQPPLNQSLIGTAVTQEQTGLLLDVLDRFMRGLSGLTVRSEHLTHRPDAAGGGISATALTERRASPVTDRLTRFLAALDQMQGIIVQMDGSEMTHAQGDENILADLLDVSRAIWGDPGTIPDAPDNAQFIVLESVADGHDPVSTVLAKAGQGRLLLQVEHASAPDLTARWLSCA